MNYKGVDWRYYHGALIPNQAPHIPISLTKDEARELLAKSKAYFVRWVSEWDRSESEFWYVIKDNFSGLEEFSSNTRSKVRRGLRQCEVKRVSSDEIVEDGYEVYKNAFSRYNTDIKPLNKEDFKRGVLNSKSEFWAVYRESILIAYSQNVIENGSVNYSVIKFDPKYLKFYPSYALFYEMNRFYLDKKQFLYVNDGARSISHDTNIQNFLIDKFKFKRAYCKLNIYYRRDLEMLVKALYPFKGLIKGVNFLFPNKLSILMEQERIRRSFEQS